MIEIRPPSILASTWANGSLVLHHLFSQAAMAEGSPCWGELHALNRTVLPPGGKLGQPIAGRDVVTVVRRGTVRLDCGTLPRIATAGQIDVIASGAAERVTRTNLTDEPAEYLDIQLRGHTPAVPGHLEHRAATFPGDGLSGNWALVASGLPEDRIAVPLRSGARVLAASMPVGSALRHELEPGRRAYVLPLAGTVAANGIVLQAGGGAAIMDETHLRLEALAVAELILIETI
jgi:redox-sensitive bicupin YhaK (pirin superfamily)